MEVRGQLGAAAAAQPIRWANGQRQWQRGQRGQHCHGGGPQHVGPRPLAQRRHGLLLALQLRRARRVTLIVGHRHLIHAVGLGQGPGLLLLLLLACGSRVVGVMGVGLVGDRRQARLEVVGLEAA